MSCIISHHISYHVISYRISNIIYNVSYHVSYHKGISFEVTFFVGIETSSLNNPRLISHSDMLKLRNYQYAVARCLPPPPAFPARRVSFTGQLCGNDFAVDRYVQHSYKTCFYKWKGDLNGRKVYTVEAMLITCPQPIGNCSGVAPIGKHARVFSPGHNGGSCLVW
jgi:hypothetical protein